MADPLYTGSSASPPESAELPFSAAEGSLMIDFGRSRAKRGSTHLEIPTKTLLRTKPKSRQAIVLSNLKEMSRESSRIEFPKLGKSRELSKKNPKSGLQISYFGRILPSPNGNVSVCPTLCPYMGCTNVETSKSNCKLVLLK